MIALFLVAFFTSPFWVEALHEWSTERVYRREKAVRKAQWDKEVLETKRKQRWEELGFC